MEGHTLITTSDDVCALHSDNLHSGSTDGCREERAPRNEETALLRGIDAVDVANNNVLTSNGTGLMSSRKHPDVASSYPQCFSCVCLSAPSAAVAGMESPSGPRLGKLSSSGLPRGRTPKHGHPQESVRTAPGPENNNRHSKWRVTVRREIETAWCPRGLTAITLFHIITTG